MDIKVNQDRTIVALRTTLPAPREWGYMSHDQGGGYLTDNDVKDWDDVEVPDAEPVEPAPVPEVPNG